MVNILRQASRNARAGMAQVGDNAFTNIGRSMRKIGSGYQGSRAYNDSFAVAKSTFAREMLDADIGRKAFAHMHQAIKHLKHYNKKHIERLEKRYEHHPRNLDKHLTHLAEQFASDLELFSTSLNKYIQSINDALLRANEEFGVDNELIVGLLVRYAEIVEKHHVIIPIETIHRIEKKIIILEKQNEKSARKAAKEDYSVLKKDRRGHIGHVARMNWHKVRKVIRGTEEKEVDDLRENLRIMQRELENEEAKLSFLAYFIHYLDNKKVLNKAHEQICMDFLTMLERADKYFMEMEGAIQVFKAMFQGYKVVKEIEKEIDELARDHKEIRTAIETDIKSQKGEYDISKKVTKQVRFVLERLINASKKQLQVSAQETQRILERRA